MTFQNVLYIFTIGLAFGFITAFIPYFISFTVGHLLKLISYSDLEDE